MVNEWNEWIMGEEVLKRLGINNLSEEYSDFSVYAQGSKSDFEINEILKKCGGKPHEWSLTKQPKEKGVSGIGKPDYIIRYKGKNLVFLVENKTEINYHQSTNLDGVLNPSLYNLDGLLYFASYFKDKFDVLGLAVSGEKEKWRVSFFAWPQGQKNFSSEIIQEQSTIYSLKEYSTTFLPPEIKSDFDVERIREIARKLNEIIYQGLGFAQEEKPFFISACLIALKDQHFRNHFQELGKEKLISACQDAIRDVIKEIGVKEEKESKYNELESKLKGIIASNVKLISTPANKKNSFRNILREINQEVWPFIDKGDVIGEFYHEFLKYSSGDGKGLGIVLTPSHIADLFCDLALKILGREKFNADDKILDVCCGTGSFLVGAFGRGASKENIYGIETNPGVYNLALTNMILCGDGKSHIYRKDCFDKEMEKIIKEANCNIALLNPPYSQKKKKESEGKAEIEFIEYSCDLLKSGSLVFAIVPLSTAIGTKYKEERRRIMKKHTLKAVMTMPSDLFAGNDSGSHTCIMFWETGRKHQGETWLTNWKDDGFVILKGKRIDKEKNWPKVKLQWLNDLWKRDKYSSVSQQLNYEDCWLADAYVETDYTKLTEKHFEKTIRDYLAFRISVLEE